MKPRRRFGLAFLMALVILAAPLAATAAGAGVGASRAERFAALGAVAERQGEVALIVRFDEIGTAFPDLPPQAQQARMRAIQALRERLLGDLAGWGPLNNVKRFDYTPHVAFSTDARVLRMLEFHPLALEVVEDELRAPTLGQTVPLIHADTGAWASGYTGAGQTIAILDSGVDKTHPFLANKVVSEACYSTTNAAYGSTSLCPGGQDTTADGSGVNCTGISGCDHGTHVAGIASGKNYAGGPGFNGVAKDAQLIAIQVFSRFDSATYCGSSTPCIMSYDSDQMAALQRVYALRSTYAIASANMSLGGGRYYANCDGDPLKPSIDNLRSAGIAVAIASGNNGYRDSISGPACISSAISVGSTCDSSNGYCTGVDAIASYSNIASFVSLLAPGSAVTSSVPGGYATWHGTSMATPHVAGAWALKKQQSPTASVATILADLRATGVTLNDSRSGGTVTGLERINFVAATNYTLTVTNGGNGTVTSAPTGINCGATCTASFAASTTVTLTATPAANYQFAGWSGACSGTSTTCALTMSGNASVSASFTAVQTNHAPVASDDSYNATAGSTLIVSAPGVLANDSDPDGNALTAQQVSSPTKGTLSLSTNGGFTYTPQSGASGTDSFSYRASDGSLTSNLATVTFNIASCTLPAAPTGLTATSLTQRRIQLAWTDASSNESGFKVQRSSDGGATWADIASLGAGVTSYTDSNLKAGRSYRYHVRSWNACGDSANSNDASATARR